MGHLPDVGADAVVRAYDAARFGTLDELRNDRGDRGLLAARMQALRRPLPTRNKRGLTLAAMSALVGVERSTLTALLEHHGYLELVPFGGHQRRRLVTQTAFDAGVGHNADPSRTRSRNLDGEARAIVFPVFYAEAVPSIMWSLDWEGIRRDAAGVPNKRDRMRWLLSNHPYLPDQTLADLAGYSLRGLKKARSLGRDEVGSHLPPLIGPDPAP